MVEDRFRVITMDHTEFLETIARIRNEFDTYDIYVDIMIVEDGIKFVNEAYGELVLFDITVTIEDIVKMSKDFGLEFLNHFKEEIDSYNRSEKPL